MNSNTSATLVFSVLAALLAVFFPGFCIASTAFQNEVKFEQNIGRQLPLDVMLTDEHGVKRSFGSYFDFPPMILVFSYYQCPNLCTLVLNGLVDGLKNIPDILGKEYKVLSVSIDP